ncbi:MAG: hypothetical protein JOZ25_10190 [Actinobacteria bacterium]|nr:hypothetical protein [Actinomycetota bacterium]
MADAARSEGRPRPRLSVAGTWRRLGFEQRVAAVGALLLIVSTLGPFSFVEGAILLLAGGVLLLLRKRAEGRRFHIPFGDGTIVAAAGAWAGVLIFVRLFDRPLGQGLLALACAALLILAGLRERAKRPPDDVAEAETAPVAEDPGGPRVTAAAPVPERGREAPGPRTEPPAERARYRDETLPLSARAGRGAGERPVTPAKVLPPPPTEADLEEPPAYEGPPSA